MAKVALSIAVLDCDIPVPNVFEERGTYADIFEALLRKAAVPIKRLSESDLAFSSYDCTKGILPSLNDLERIDGVIITGSAASANDEVPWIKSLLAWTRTVYTSYPNIHLFGSCFGHQLIAHALFSTPSHSVVRPDPQGWELGVHSISLTPAILSHFGAVSSNPESPSELRLQFIHADHVVLHPIPDGWVALGSSEHCVLQGLWERGRVLTFQGHAEFDRFVNGETLRYFAKKGLEGEVLEKGLRGVQQNDDAQWAARMMLKFFLEGEAKGRDEVKDTSFAGRMNRSNPWLCFRDT